jgi:hypothetical protein
MMEITSRVNEQLEQDGESAVSERMIYLDIKNMQEQYPVTIIKRERTTHVSKPGRVDRQSSAFR